MSQRVLITAGASDIGKEIASAYAAIGAQVCVCGINEKALQSAAKGVSKRATSKPMVAASVKALCGLDKENNVVSLVASGRAQRLTTTSMVHPGSASVRGG